MRDDGNGVVNVKYQNSTKIKNSMAKIEVKTDVACPYSLEPFEIGSDFKVDRWGVRHTQCVLLFFTLTVAYSMRSCMGVALVAMIQSDIPDIHEHTDTLIIINDTEHLFNKSNIDLMNREAQFEVNGVLNALMLIPPFPKYKWTKKTQDVILSSFFWGYMALQIPAGQLAHRFGTRRLLFGAMIMNCIIPIIMPIVTYYGGWICTVLCRVLQGMTQACIVPGFHTFFGKWTPLEERGRLTAMVYGGQAIGTVLGLPITGFIGASYLGWPGIFRFYGLLSGLIAIVLWFMLGDSPAQHKAITFDERRYIEEALGQIDGEKSLPVPWKKIFTSTGMLAIIIAHIGNTWGQLTLFTEIPSYMDKVMGVNIKANGLLTALPFLVMWFTNFFFSWITDMLIVKKYLNVTQTRKLANSLACIPSAIGLVALAYAPHNIYIVETILVLICSFKIASTVGFHVNHVDISPNYAGTLMSISNFASNMFGSLAPIVAGIILTDPTDPLLWRKVFFVAAGLYFFTNLVYVIFGTAELAEWNDPPQYDKVALDENKSTKEKTTPTGSV
ncbi:hypothetical protein evm_011373 [Chilo suppressalis]|nr:hypothetical protein evm_011373 [Chilo suppressalis]